MRQPLSSVAPGATLLPPVGRVSVDVPFAGDLDVRAVLAGVPHEQRLKGMFYQPLVDELGADWGRVVTELVEPPRFGRFLPFTDYALVDHADLAFRAARRRHPDLGLREAIRRVARADMLTFLGSTLGRITAAVVRSPSEALLAVPGVYKSVSRGPVFSAEAQGPTQVTLWLANGYGSWEYSIGQLEGIVGHYGVRPVTECEQQPDGRRRFELSW